MKKYFLVFIAVFACAGASLADDDRIDPKKCMKKCMEKVKDQVLCEKVCL